MKIIFKRLRGAVGNALVWGAAWFGITLALLSILYVAGDFPVMSWEFVLRGATSMGGVGFLAGGGFSAFLALAYRERRLLDINIGWFALGGAVVAGVGGALIANGALLGAIFGGVTAAGTIKLAKRASRRLSDSALEELSAEQDQVIVLLGEEVTQDQ